MVSVKKAVFLDRDGVINNNSKHYYIYKEEDFEFVEGIQEILLQLSRLDYLLIIITNQGGIAKGIYSMKDVEKLHSFMQRELEKQGITITDIYVCPHYPDYGSCLCRKPGSLLIEKALSFYNIAKSRSVFIGDSETDMISAASAGISKIKVEGNKNMLYNYQVNLLLDNSFFN